MEAAAECPPGRHSRRPGRGAKPKRLCRRGERSGPKPWMAVGGPATERQAAAGKRWAAKRPAPG